MAGRIGVIIPAAGAGKRLGGISKPLLEIGGKPILLRLLDLFADIPEIARICVAAPADALSDFKRLADASEKAKLTDVIEGGQERPLSVRNAFDLLAPHLTGSDLVCIHDAARPLLAREDLRNVIEAAWKHGAAFLASKVKDTLKVVDGEGFCVSTVDRSNVFAAQTPQVMRSEHLKKAYGETVDCSTATDEIMLLERIGIKAFVVESRHLNFKVTTAEDLDLLRKVIS